MAKFRNKNKDEELDRQPAAGTDCSEEVKTENEAEEEAAGEETAAEEKPAAEEGTASEEEKEGKDSREEELLGLIAEKEKKAAELEDRFKRLFAEFDNFRKRSATEKSGMYAEGEKAVLEKVLPLIDNFERALANVPEELKGNAYVDGMEKIYRSFMDAMAAIGLQPIEAAGKSFDANLHNAVMHVEDEEAGENMVVEEFQKGYMFKDKVLRYSMVKVAN